MELEHWEKVTFLDSILAMSADLKKIKILQSLFRGFEQIKPYNLLVRMQISSLSPCSSLCSLSGNHSKRLFQKTIRFWLKNQWPSVGAVLLVVGLQAQTHVISSSDVVALGNNLLAWGKVQPFLQYWLSSRVKKILCKFWAVTKEFFFSSEENIEFCWFWQ